MRKPAHAVAETRQFIRDAEHAGLTEAEIATIVDIVSREPLAGDEVPGSGGVYKRRIAGRGKGKSGGFRIMTAYVGERAPVYLLALLSKGERANFSRDEISSMRVAVEAIRRHWKLRRMT